MLAFILKWLGDEALSGLLSLIQSEIAKRNLIAQGQASQAAAETASSERTQAGMAQAEADAPVSKTEAMARLENGTA